MAMFGPSGRIPKTYFVIQRSPNEMCRISREVECVEKRLNLANSGPSGIPWRIPSYTCTNQMSQVRKFKEKQERERWKKEKERKKAASEILERHRGNKDSMKAIRRNLNNTKSADKSREILDSEERRHRDALEREKDKKNGLCDQVCT